MANWLPIGSAFIFTIPLLSILLRHIPNSQQNRLEWEEAYLRAAALRRSSRARKKRCSLLSWLSPSRSPYDSYESLPAPDLSANDTTEAANESLNRNVKLLYIFSRKL